MSDTKKKKRDKQENLIGLGDLLGKYEKPDKNKYVSREFQDFGYRLAAELGDLKHKSLYIKLAKTEERGVLEKALSFVKDSGARKPGALFMWKLKELKKETQKLKSTKA